MYIYSLTILILTVSKHNKMHTIGIYTFIITSLLLTSCSTQKKVVKKAEPHVLKGSWGARLYVRAGGTLNNYVKPKSNGGKGYNYLAGAKEMVESYPTMGHVITNATNNAKSHLWTLRTNENVDAVMGYSGSIINEEFVPSIENEQVIIDIISEFKKANKKVILYLNAMSPAERATPSGNTSWNNYVNKYFKGNEHKAWMNFCEGYIKRFAKMGVDGYWIDAFSSYPGNKTEKGEFVQMIRTIDPDVIISTNYAKDYFTDKNNILLKVDSDGIDDENDKDYKIVKLTAKDPWSDFTAGHITPLKQGAPPNSWAYEEFTVPDIKLSPTTTYNGTKQTTKHLFLPIRATWSGERSELMFNEKQAYRFVKNIVDAGGAVTFSTTTDKDGTTMEDEEKILKFVNQQLKLNTTPSKYTRPKGASLVK